MLHGTALKRILALLAAAGLLAAVVSLAQGQALAPATSSFEIVVPLKAIQDQSRDLGLDPAAVLASLSEAGIGAALIEERTLADLDLLGGLIVLRGAEAEEAAGLVPGLAEWRASEPGVPVTLFSTASAELADWVQDQTLARFGSERVARFDAPDQMVVAVRGDLPPYTRIGLYPPDIDSVRQVGLRLVVQMQNPREDPGLSMATALRPLTADTISYVDAVVFGGAEVWGYGQADGPAQAGRDLALLGLSFAVDTNRPQAGIAQLAETDQWRSVGVQEIWTTGRPELYAEGIVERRAPLLIVMSGFLQAHANDPDWPAGMISDLAAFQAGISERGPVEGPPVPVPSGRPAAVWDALAALGLLAAILLAARRAIELLGMKVDIIWRAVLAAGVIVAAVLPFVVGSTAWVTVVQLLTLVGSLTLPVLILDPVLRTWTSGRPARWFGPALAAVLWFAVLATGSALLIRGLGAGPEFTAKTAFFRGIKLELVAGPVWGVILLWLTATFGRTGKWHDLKAWFGGLLRSRITLKTVLVGVAVLLVGLYYVSRSGNTPLIPVSDLEFRIRRYLLDLLVVRPRTKEIVLGYPAVIAGVWLSVRLRKGVADHGGNGTTAGGSGAATGGEGATARGPADVDRTGIAWSIWGYLLAALAGVGASSVLNTFSHFHIPAVTSLIRAAWGLLGGILVGLAAVGVLRLILGGSGRPAGEPESR